jgi:hypothetical protein
MAGRWINFIAAGCLLFAAQVAAAQATYVASRAAAKTTNLSTSTVVRTGGYFTPGDGGSATFRKLPANTQPTDNGGATDTGASFTDLAGNVWQYVVDPEGINIRQFGAKCDWNLAQDGNRNYSAYDAAAHDDRASLQNAIDFAALQFADGNDKGGGAGQVVRIPAGACKIAAPVRVKDQVVVAGEGPMSSVLIMPQNYDHAEHFITLGSLDSPPEASFGARLEDLQLWSVNVNGDYNKAMVYSNNTQHTGGLFRVKIFAGNRSGVFLQEGIGGASMYYMEHVEVYNVGGTEGANNNPGIILNYYGSTISNIRNLIVQGPGTGGTYHIGVRIDSGQVKIDGFHTEGVPIGIDVNLNSGDSHANQSNVRLVNLTGGNGCRTLIQIESTVTAPLVVGQAAPNGCITVVGGVNQNRTVSDGRSGASPVNDFIAMDRLF